MTTIPCDDDFKDRALGQGDPFRALQVTIDSKRPRFILKESLAAGASLTEDCEKVLALLGEEPSAVLIKLADESNTLGARDKDHVLIVWVPEEAGQGVKAKWAGGTASLLQALPELRIKVLSAAGKGEITKEAVLAKGKEAANIPEPGKFDVSGYYAAEDAPDTKDYIMQQTMIRVRDPKVSLEFYTKTLGFNLVMHRNFPQWGFSVYFVAYVPKEQVPTDDQERWNFCMKSPACIELTWNHGSEKEAGPVYNTGNSDATGTQDGQKVKGGFGHLGITVPDVYAACERFKTLGVTMTKSPNSGGMKGLAFIKDPDGYLIEILPQGPMVAQPVDCNGVAAEGGEGYKDNSK